jgi:hypothetical protein
MVPMLTQIDSLSPKEAVRSSQFGALQSRHPRSYGTVRAQPATE